MKRQLSPRMQHFLFSLVRIFILVGLCYFFCLGLGSLEVFQAYFWKGRALFFSGLRLGIGPAFSFVFLTVICALFDPIDVLTKHMNPAGILNYIDPHLALKRHTKQLLLQPPKRNMLLTGKRPL